MTRAIIFAAALLAACTGLERNSSEAAWRRAQCDQILNEKMRQACLDRVSNEFGRW